MAAFTIAEQQSGDTTIINLSGDLIFGDANLLLRNTVRQNLSEGRHKLAFNLEGVEYLDSSGIGELISALTAIGRIDGGRLKFLNPTKRILHLFEISKLSNIFDIEFIDSKSSGNL